MVLLLPIFRYICISIGIFAPIHEQDLGKLSDTMCTYRFMQSSAMDLDYIIIPWVIVWLW